MLLISIRRKARNLSLPPETEQTGTIPGCPEELPRTSAAHCNAGDRI